ncbi:ABC transporter permease [Bacteroides sp. 519]|uniref:ABC transporter permease n=1 Tax=Bacteroides sp. 519 TaxID=2302937 RepID=UPI0013D7B07C|nr:ABC transporter permease [Bacteroides sp. 519]NDV59451.1 ABC transporter permease [Bacteroides sp. 519]
MKQFIAFIKKEFYHIFRDVRTMLILLGMPIAQIIIFGFAITTEVTNIRIAVYDLSKDVSTRQIIQKLEANKYFTLAMYLNNPEEINKVMEEGKVNMVLVFDSDFHTNMLHTGEASVQVIVDATDPNQASTITNYVTNLLTQYQQETSTQRAAAFRINPQIRMLYNPQMEGAYNFVPGVMGMILMLICAMMTSIAIVREKERGSMEILLASPIKPIFIIVSKAVPYFVLSIINLSTILMLSVFVLKVPISGSLLLIISASLLFILVALLFGLLISNVVQTQVAAMLISGMGLMLPTMLLSGMMFPVESMPPLLQWIASVMPARWYIQAIKKLMIQGVDGIYVIKEFTIMLIMILFLLVVSIRTFKMRK